MGIQSCNNKKIKEKCSVDLRNLVFLSARNDYYNKYTTFHITSQIFILNRLDVKNNLYTSLVSY